MARALRLQPSQHIVLNAKRNESRFGTKPERYHFGKLLIGQRWNIREINLRVWLLRQAFEAATLLLGEGLTEDSLGFHAHSLFWPR